MARRRTLLGLWHSRCCRATAAACLLGTAAGALDSEYNGPQEDAVHSLPGYGVPRTRHWSGYLDASEAEPGTKLHYWFAEAEVSDPHTAPVVLWLNGGPGSSSILGMLLENGPLLINATGGLMDNPYAWTKQANLVALESPAGVGYSFCAAMATGGSCSNTDVTTAKAARAALQYLFGNKFPHLRKNDFFISGESYAGVYIPTLAKELLTNAPEVNLQGVAVGDPCTDGSSQRLAFDMLWYAHKHGLVPDDDFDLLFNQCRVRHPHFLTRGSWSREGGRWSKSVLAATRSPVIGDPAFDRKCKIAHRRFIATTSRGLSQSWPNSYINELDLFADASALDWTIPGTLNYFTAQWMQRDDVRQALNVKGGPVQSWPGPPDGWQYTSSYDACNDAAQPGVPSMVDFYREIAPRLSRTIVFNGDTDPCVSYEGTRLAIQKVGFPVIPGGQYRPWFYNKTGVDIAVLQQKPGLFGPTLELRDAGPQFGGQVVDYEHGLSFATVHGSGHMVPQFRPQAAEQILHRLLSRTPFAPPLPEEEALASWTDEQFDKAVDAWTADARAAVSIGGEIASIGGATASDLSGKDASAILVV